MINMSLSTEEALTEQKQIQGVVPMSMLSYK